MTDAIYFCRLQSIYCILRQIHERIQTVALSFTLSTGRATRGRSQLPKWRIQSIHCSCHYLHSEPTQHGNAFLKKILIFQNYIKIPIARKAKEISGQLRKLVAQGLELDSKNRQSPLRYTLYATPAGSCRIYLCTPVSSLYLCVREKEMAHSLYVLLVTICTHKKIKWSSL